MAQIINDPNDPNKQNQPNSPQNPPGGQNPIVQGTSAPTSSGQAQPVKSAYPAIGTPARNKQQGSGFTNLQRVMGANQNNRLGQTVGQGIRGTQQQYGQNVQQSGQQFQQQAAGSKLDTEGNKQYVQNVLGKVTQDPTQIGQAEYDQFGNLRAGKYAGPSGLQNYAELQAQAGDVGQLGDLTRSAGGRQALLQRFIGGNKGYTQGQQNLDTLLLGQSGQNQLAQARVGSRSANPALAQQEAAARALAQQYAGENKAFGENVLGQVIGTREKETARLGQTAQEAEAQKQADIEVLRRKLGVGNQGDIALTKAQAEMLGLKGGEELNVGALSAFTPDQLKADISNVAQQKDYAAMDALARLGGYNKQAEFMDPSRAGSFFKNQYGFNQLDAQQKDIAEKAAAELAAQQRRNEAAAHAIGGSDFQQYQGDIGSEFGSGNVYNTAAKAQYFKDQAAQIQKQLDAIRATPSTNSLLDQLKAAQAAGDTRKAAILGMQISMGGGQQAAFNPNVPKIDPTKLQFEDAQNSLYTPEGYSFQSQIDRSRAPTPRDTHQSGYDTETEAYNRRMNELYGTQEAATKTYQDILNAYQNQAKRYEDETARYKGYQTEAEKAAQNIENKYGYKATGLGGLQGRKVMIDDEEAARQAALLAMSGMSGGGTSTTLANQRNRQS